MGMAGAIVTGIFIMMASATVEFATRMGSLFRQQVRAPEKEKLIFGEPHANSNECSAGNEFSGRSFQIGNVLGFCVTNLLNVISKCSACGGHKPCILEITLRRIVTQLQKPNILPNQQFVFCHVWYQRYPRGESKT